MSTSERQFIKLDGFPGHSTHPDYTGWIDVLSCSYGVSHSSTPRTANPDGDDHSGKSYVVKASGKPRFQALTFTHCTGNGTHSLRRYCDEKVPIPKIEFRACKPAGSALQAYLTLTLGDCRLTTVTPLGDPDDPQALEHVSLRYGTIQLEARETKEDGTLGESTIAGWDIGRNAELP